MVFRAYGGLVSMLYFEFMTLSQERQLSKLIGSHKPTHVINETYIYSIYITEYSTPSEHLINSNDVPCKNLFCHNPDSSRFAGKGQLILLTSSSVAIGLAHSKLII